MMATQGFSNQMRLLVTGGRNFDEAALVYDVLSQLHKHYAIGVLIHGGARGADSHAGQWASLHGVHQTIFLPDWKRHGLLAGHDRNTRMLTEGKPGCLHCLPRRQGHGGYGAKGQDLQASCLEAFFTQEQAAL